MVLTRSSHQPSLSFLWPMTFFLSFLCGHCSYLVHSLGGQRMSLAYNWTLSEAIFGPWEHRENFLFSVQLVSPTSSWSSGSLCWLTFLLLWNAVWLSHRGAIAQRLVSGLTGRRCSLLTLTTSVSDHVRKGAKQSWQTNLSELLHLLSYSGLTRSFSVHKALCSILSTKIKYMRK